MWTTWLGFFLLTSNSRWVTNVAVAALAGEASGSVVADGLGATIVRSLGTLIDIGTAVTAREPVTGETLWTRALVSAVDVVTEGVGSTFVGSVGTLVDVLVASSSTPARIASTNGSLVYNGAGAIVAIGFTAWVGQFFASVTGIVLIAKTVV